MTTPTFIERGHCTVTKIQEGRTYRIIPLSMEVEMKQGNEFDKLLQECGFKEYIEAIINRKPYEDSFSYQDDFKLKQLQKDIKDSKIKIRVILELEKYE